MSVIFKRPEIKSVDFCIDENIWGHRLYDEQLPHLTVLEFLGALGSNLDRPLRNVRYGCAACSSTTLMWNPFRRANSPTKKSGGNGWISFARVLPAMAMA